MQKLQQRRSHCSVEKHEDWHQLNQFEIWTSIFVFPGRSHTGDVCVAKGLTQYYSIIQIKIKECKGTLFLNHH